MTQPAKVLAPVDVRRLLEHVDHGRFAARNIAMVLLSFKAGLRACEIAGLSWEMVCNARGGVDSILTIAGTIAKNGRGRRIPVHPALHNALARLHRAAGRPTAGAVIQSQRRTHMSAGSVVNWFTAIFREVGLNGCSSHSGRRTFITQAARLIAKTGGSLRDIQELAGHADLATTERYIECDREAQRKLVRLL